MRVVHLKVDTTGTSAHETVLGAGLQSETVVGAGFSRPCTPSRYAGLNGFSSALGP